MIILSVFLSIFLLASALGLSTDALFLRGTQGGGAAGLVIGVALLVLDVVLPVPSSIIMIANGAVYGPWLGTAASLAGGLGATMFGYYIGRRGEKTALKFISQTELEKGAAFFKRWGILAVIMTRPVPLMSETIAVMAGLAGWGAWRTALYALTGYLPVCIIYALSGAYATQSHSGTFVFLLVMATGLLVWAIANFFKNKQHLSNT